MTKCNEIINGNCEDVLKDFPDDYFQLLITSPPYADQRKKTYGGIETEEYVSWFLPKADQFLRTLKPTGTFVLNIKEKVVDGERHTYVFDLISALRKQGWFWTEEFIWHKKNAVPGKWINRFRDSWERLLQFNKEKKFDMYQEEVMIPIGDWANDRLKKLGKNDIIRHNSEVNSGFGRKLSNWVGKDKVYPTNVLHLPTVCSNKNHSAAFPESLPEWFIKLFSKENDIVLDPFCGSGTTCLVAKNMKRNYIGIELNEEYHKVATDRINDKIIL